jgi:hypothetical protein
MSGRADDANAFRRPTVTDSGSSASGRASGRLLSLGDSDAGPVEAVRELTAAEREAIEIEEARALIARAAESWSSVEDYVCDFHKQERIDGKLMPAGLMRLKARTKPSSLYFKFVSPNKGREAIFVAGRNDGKVLAHDVGVLKLLGGTMRLDPKGSMAMTDNRHPITEAGLGELIATVSERWRVELSPEVSDITIEPGTLCCGRTCTMVDSTHPVRRADFFFYKVRLFFDDELGLPIRYEAYDWPKPDGTPGDLLEEYTYENLETNVGLTDINFDPANPAYSFGRF